MVTGRSRRALAHWDAQWGRTVLVADACLGLLSHVGKLLPLPTACTVQTSGFLICRSQILKSNRQAGETEKNPAVPEEARTWETGTRSIAPVSTPPSAPLLITVMPSRNSSTTQGTKPQGPLSPPHSFPKPVPEASLADLNCPALPSVWTGWTGDS